MVLHLVFLAFLCHSSVLVVSLNDEGFALLSFKEAIEDYQDGFLNNWNPSDTNPCSWNGVTCKEGKVISLRIPNRMLSGFLHPALGKLVSLRHVNLRNNKFYGSLPSELCTAKGLQGLVLSGNSFSGPVPLEIGNLKYLQNLDLSNNSFNGTIPSSLGQCTRLKSLILSSNSFYGSLPVAFGINLISLQNLNLSFNKLSGSIPSSIGNLSSLQGTLDLSHNSFNGSIPVSLGSLSEKLYIDLSYNNLSGFVPENAVLLNSGPTAFVGNPLLCGTPLKVPCSSRPRDGYDQSLARDPSQSSGANSVRSGKGSSYSSVMARAIAGAAAGICLMGLLLTYWYKKVWPCKGLKHGGGCKETLTISKEISCFRKDYLETLSENPENYGFIPLDSNINFDLENLLKASAFLLGKSGIGILYKVSLANGITVAVRRLGDGGSQRFREFQTEVEVIGKVRHPNIVSLRAYCWSVDEKLLIYDYIPNGDLATAIHGKAGIVSYKPLPWSVRLRIIKGMAKGLAFLHEFSPKRYIHGSVKPTNVLLRENMEPCISDFGLGQLANITEEYLTEQTTAGMPVTPQQSSPHHFTTANLSSARSYYQAPEASKVTKPSQKWDVYSYGVILLELISGKSPMVQMGAVEMDLVRWIQLSIDVGKPLSAVLDPFLTRDLEVENEVFLVIKISLACVRKNPDKRPSMKYVSDYLDRLASPA